MKSEHNAGKMQYIAPVLAAALMGALMLAMLGLFYWAYHYDDMPFGVMAVCCVVVAVIAMGVLAALVQRLREIGGEEYDARQY